jgi:hypothetical protein
MSTPYVPPPKTPPTSDPSSAKIDKRTVAVLDFPSSVTGSLIGDLAVAPRLGFIPSWPDLGAVVECEGGRVEIFNFVMPTLYHWIKVTVQGDSDKKQKVRVEKKYDFGSGGKGEDWWTT